MKAAERRFENAKYPTQEQIEKVEQDLEEFKYHYLPFVTPLTSSNSSENHKDKDNKITSNDL